jgi:type I site-specific restriction endonuclease
MEGLALPETPEEKARREIDAKLTAAGWVLQDRKDIDLTVGRGIAVREFPMKAGFGFADYLLYLDKKALGAVEAKAELSPYSPASARAGWWTCRTTQSLSRMLSASCSASCGN